MKQLGMQRETGLTPAEELTQWRQHFEEVYGAGWKIGYHDNPNKRVVCPFESADDRRIFNYGICDGSDAREKLQPRPEDMPVKSEAEAA